MVSKHGIEIRRAKIWLDSDAKTEMFNGGVFRGFGAHPPFAEDWRLESNASSRRRHGGLAVEVPAFY